MYGLDGLSVGQGRAVVMIKGCVQGIELMGLAECMDRCLWADGNYFVCYMWACCVGCSVDGRP